jgi:hypothetical protein
MATRHSITFFDCINFEPGGSGELSRKLWVFFVDFRNFSLSPLRLKETSPRVIDSTMMTVRSKLAVFHHHHHHHVYFNTSFRIFLLSHKRICNVSAITTSSRHLNTMVVHPLALHAIIPESLPLCLPPTPNHRRTRTRRSQYDWIRVTEVQ